MIGQLLSMRYIGKKPWGVSAIYWILGWFLWIFDILIAHYVYKVPWPQAAKIWVLGFVFDIIIIMLLWTFVFAAIFGNMWGLVGGLPGAFLAGNA